MADLTNAAVSGSEVWGSCDRLWDEWLRQYFNGGTHRVAGLDLVFPVAEICAGRVSPSQPLEGVSISFVGELGEQAVYQGGVLPEGGAAVQERVTEMRWMFYVRAAVLQAAGSGGNHGNARELCRRTADLLRALLRDPSRAYELQKKGIFNVRAGRCRSLPGDRYEVRDLAVDATLDYLVATSI